MDPEANIKAINEALAAADRELALELARELAEWLRQGGYEPPGAWTAITAARRANVTTRTLSLRTGPAWIIRGPDGAVTIQPRQQGWAMASARSHGRWQWLCHPTWTLAGALELATQRVS